MDPPTISAWGMAGPVENDWRWRSTAAKRKDY